MTDLSSIKILKKYWGYSAFRPGQSEVIEALQSGRDTLAIMPTGAGKSICYQVPALFYFLNKQGTTLVISPLISLMDDQLAHLREKGIPAAGIHSGLPKREAEKILRRFSAGEYALFYVSPERLVSERFREAAMKVRIAMLVTDEAHCIAKWGPSFRPSYREIPEFASIFRKRPVMAALTATADAAIKKEILSVLALKDPFVLATGFDRPNLFYGIEYPEDKAKAILAYILRHPGQSGIVYCAMRRSVEFVTDYLTRRGVRALPYHAGLPDEARERNQELFMKGAVPVIVATNAFGMGIDKPDIRFVLHFHMPRDMEGYYQEAGRAGRDGLTAECILFYTPADRKAGQYFNAHERVTSERIKGREQLRVMRNYAAGRECLRSYILQYFGENISEKKCGCCSVCTGRGVWPYRWKKPASESLSDRFKRMLTGKPRFFTKQDEELYEDLLVLRAQMAKDRKLRPDKIFPDSVLREMVYALPVKRLDLFFLSNIRWINILRFGEEFAREIAVHVKFYRLER